MKKRELQWTREGECMVVTSHKPGSNGYILYSVNGHPRLLHRIVCERRHGDITGRIVRHTCDHKQCINSDHLIPGTQLENQQDMVAKGRSSKGENHSHAKLTPSEVLQIRESGLTAAVLALKFKVSVPTIGNIRRRVSWRHI